MHTGNTHAAPVSGAARTRTADGQSGRQRSHRPPIPKGWRCEGEAGRGSPRLTQGIRRARAEAAEGRPAVALLTLYMREQRNGGYHV